MFAGGEGVGRGDRRWGGGSQALQPTSKGSYQVMLVKNLTRVGVLGVGVTLCWTNYSFGNVFLSLSISNIFCNAKPTTDQKTQIIFSFWGERGHQSQEN